MRTIKFRGISKQTNKFIYGFLSSNEDEYFIGNHGANYKFEEVYKQSIGQFTGLTDKTGVPIYEGDIMEIGVLKTKVEYIFCGFRATTLNENLCFYPRLDLLKIIGNIHQNPELLK